MASGWDRPIALSEGSPDERDAAPRFVLLGELASGGMGSVDLVRMTDAAGERIVAMKRIHPHFARDAEFVQMFRDEIWLTQGLYHPNVVQLIGWGDDEDGPYLVMEFVDGAPLAELAYQCRKMDREFPEELAAFVAARVAEGLYAAHTLTDADGRPLALVHRDITPSNVLVGFDGSIKITDFGIAKAAASGSHTRTGIVKGKLEYMSPEHALRRAVDGRSDLYSLGILLFELLAGHPPFHGGADLDLLKRVAYEPVPSLVSVVPGIDADLAALVDGLAAKLPSDRPADGAAVARALDEWLTGRGLVRVALEAKLAELAVRFGAARRRRLRKLMAVEGLELGSSSSWRDPKRVRSATLPAPGTFTRAVAVPSHELPSGTRAISVASPPLPSQPPPAPEPSPQSGEHRVTRRVGVARAAAVPIPVPVAEVAESVHKAARPRWIAYAAGLAMACVLVGLVVLVSVRVGRSARPEPEEPSIEAQPSPHDESVPAVEPRLPAADPEPAVTIEAPAPSETVESAPPPARAGQRRPAAAKVQTRTPPKSRSKPCTPDRFDYPACLRR